MQEVTRRDALKIIAASAVSTSCAKPSREPGDRPSARIEDIDPVVAVSPLGSEWATKDPFLFCVHHDDAYPAGNEQLGPAPSLEGRNIGRDFSGKDGWRMYHGTTVPGFPRHPHRGFETVTVVRRGMLDHSDSLGATARYGRGDVQWLTAGRGIQHAEMFPLLRSQESNPLELFQIWLNLPSSRKMVAPHFSMLWQHLVPTRRVTDERGFSTLVTLVAGACDETRPPKPPPDSWAADPRNEVAIWTIHMEPGARWSLPAVSPGIHSCLYVFSGSSLTLGARDVPASRLIELRSEIGVALQNGPSGSEMLLLQGRPIGEPVSRHGPFVMNTREEIRQAYIDFRRTQFGGWPWERHDPVHVRDAGRFARRPDGRFERPT